MSPGAKVFLTLGGIGTLFGVLALAASKKASAAPGGGTVVVPPHDDLPPTVTPDEPEGGFVRDNPFSVPGIQDAAEASRLLLRWWAAEGQSLVNGDTAADRPSVPADFGSAPADLNGTFGARTQAAARAYQHYNGVVPEDGVLSNPLLLSLRRWAESQALPPQALPPQQSPVGPLPPIVLPTLPTAPPSSGPPPFVPLPPIAPQNPPVVPVPPAIPELPSLPALPPVLLPPVVGPGPLLPGPLPLPPLLVTPPPLPAPPQGGQGPSQGSTTVNADTAAMVNALLTAEGSKGWNKVEPTVQAWQKPRGLKVDGLFGPKSALAVAEEFGTVPLVRVWPAGSVKAKALQDYRTALVELANKVSDPTQAAQLRVSAKREQGQGFGPKRGAAAAIPSSLLVALEKVA